MNWAGMGSCNPPVRSCKLVGSSQGKIGHGDLTETEELDASHIRTR